MTQAKNLNEIEKLTPEQSIGLLIQGIKIGQSKGKYQLEEAAFLLDAISAFQIKEGAEPAPKEKQEGALGILIQAVLKAQENGAYTLEDAAILAKAISVFKQQPAPAGEVTEPVQAEEI